MNTLKAEKRSMDIKAKKLRREGYVVGNVFGKKIEGSIPVKFQKLELRWKKQLLTVYLRLATKVVR